MVSRKKAAGKARKAKNAAKAKAEEAAVALERENNNSTTSNDNGLEQQSTNELEEQKQELASTRMLQLKCDHGAEKTDICIHFVLAFKTAFHDEATRGSPLSQCLIYAHKATFEEFTEVWSDSANMEIASTLFLGLGTVNIVNGNCDNACKYATFVRYFEQHIAVELKQSQAFTKWTKIYEARKADMHTLVKFFWKRIPCSCLDEKYEEVKGIPKMGFCYNSQCAFPNLRVERSKTKYCSRCRTATYCSRECQEADWKRHKPHCDKSAAIIARFEA